MRWWSMLVRVLLALGGLSPAALTAAPVEFNLPAQPAGSALLAFARQAHVEILFAFDDLQKARSTAVAGKLEPEDALTRLLQGTEFTAQRIAKGKFTVARRGTPPGSLSGALQRADGLPAKGVRVLLPDARLTTATDKTGRFEFLAVPPGMHRLVATPPGHQALQLSNLEIVSERELSLGTRILQAEHDPSQLAPFVVEDSSDRRPPFERDNVVTIPRTAAGNLDLRRTDSGALPYTIYDRNQIARSGVVNLNEFLQRELLDADAATRPPEQDGTQPSFLAGSSNLSLRGYSADETVVLVNGRRLPEVLTTGYGALPPDVNLIPLSLVQQVEVLPISASALYSGNPVGGVINIVLRPGSEHNASEVSATYTNALAGYDAPQSSLSLLHTHNLLGGKLRLRFNASFAQASPPTEGELGYHGQRAPLPLTLKTPVYRATPNIRSADLSPLFGPGTSPRTSVAPGANGLGGLAAFAGREGELNLDFFDGPGGLATSLESVDHPYGRRQARTVYFGSATYDPAPWLQVGLETSASRTTVNRGFDVFTGDLSLPALSPINPFRRALDISLNETAPQLGENYSEARIQFASAALGLLIRLPGDWRLALDGQYSRNVTKYRGVAGVDSLRWQRLVDDGLYNPLRDTQRFHAPAEFYDRALIYRGSRGAFVPLGDYNTWDAAARATNESLALPTGLSTVNIGVDYRRNQLAPFVDERRLGNGTLLDEPVRWRGRTLQRYSAFGELQVPLFPVARLPLWLRSAEADLAVRYVASDKAKEANVAPTYGLKLDFAQGLALRGSITTSSRFPTPNMSRLALSGATALPGGGTGIEPTIIYDPIRASWYTTNVSEAINPELSPEESITQTAGLLFRRGDKHRFRASIDFVDTRKVNELIFLEPQAVVNLEKVWPERVRRGPLGIADLRGAGPILSVSTGTINVASRRSQNWTSSFGYATRVFRGTLDAHARVLYFQRYDRQVLPSTAIVDELNDPDGTASGLMKYRVNFGAGWSRRNFGFGFDGRYFHPRILPQFERASQKSDRIEGYMQYDGYVQTEVGHLLPWKQTHSSLRVQLRVNNLFASKFPRYENEPTGSGVQPYGDWRGRVYSLSVTAAF